MINLKVGTYYYKPKIDRLKRAVDATNLLEAIGRVRKDFPCSGYRTIQSYLVREHGIQIGERRLRNFLKEHSLQAKHKKKFVCTTQSNHDELTYPNLLPEMVVDDVNQVWVSDITYIRISTGFVYLAAILDIYSRKVIGWAISKNLDRELTVSALKRAIEKRSPPRGIIHHSDRGVQYLCKDYVALLGQYGFHISHSRKGNPYDNCFMETFFKTFKTEEVDLQRYIDIWDVLDRVPEFIDDVYNERRVHSKLDYVSPNEFEEERKRNKSGIDRHKVKL